MKRKRKTVNDIKKIKKNVNWLIFQYILFNKSIQLKKSNNKKLRINYKHDVTSQVRYIRVGFSLIFTLQIGICSINYIQSSSLVVIYTLSDLRFE